MRGKAEMFVLSLSFSGFDPMRHRPSPLQDTDLTRYDDWAWALRASMRRREFIAGLGSAVATPLATMAQQPTMPVVGFLRTSTFARSEHLVAALHSGLAELGFTEGRNVAIEYRWTDNSAELPALAAELVRRQVVAIVATDLRATRITT
jgi:ABC-type taurine transport system substrate-binding protein